VRITDLPTPQVLVDTTRLDANIDRMQAAASARGIALRPHAKTHKSPVIARRQIARGAIGVCCAKLGEAEVFAEAGIENIRVPYPLNPVNADRVLALASRVRLSFIVDHLAVARAWSERLLRADRPVDVLIKVDVGFHRCGIDPDEPGAVAFIEEVAGLKGLRLRGLLCHAGHAYLATSDEQLEAIASGEVATLTRLATAARARGVALDEISVGSTPAARFNLRQDGITEMRPGNYAYFDRTQVALGSASLEDCALTVLARVVSKPAPDRIILDSGSKTLSTDAARGMRPCPGFGAVLDLAARHVDETLLVERLSEEHATVKALAGSTPLEPGDLVRVLPNHSCVVSNLVDSVRIVEGDRVIETLPVAARGRIW
jgi:D-serine deaminase-like pyridoxal phosphate-dependent protein